MGTVKEAFGRRTGWKGDGPLLLLNARKQTQSSGASSGRWPMKGTSMRCKWKLSRATLLLGLLLEGSGPPAFACDIVPPERAPTVAEQMAGLSTIFGGTVVGWETGSGKMLIGSMPAACINKEFGGYDWVSESTPACQVYQEVEAALFRVDTPIVGPAEGAIVPVFMTWGDGDCNKDFNWGEQWFIAGDVRQGKVYSGLLSDAAQQVLREPIGADEIAALRKMAAEAKFDFHTLYK